jgi:hypothetical protein
MPAASAKVQNGSSSSSGGGGSGAGGGGGGSPSRLATQSQQEGSRRLFYQEAAHMLAAGAAQSSLQKSPYDFEVFLLFLPALVAGLLEPLQQTAESILVGRLGVAQASGGF